MSRQTCKLLQFWKRATPENLLCSRTKTKNCLQYSVHNNNYLENKLLSNRELCPRNRSLSHWHQLKNFKIHWNFNSLPLTYTTIAKRLIILVSLLYHQERVMLVTIMNLSSISKIYSPDKRTVCLTNKRFPWYRPIRGTWIRRQVLYTNKWLCQNCPSSQV